MLMAVAAFAHPVTVHNRDEVYSGRTVVVQRRAERRVFHPEVRRVTVKRGVRR